MTRARLNLDLPGLLVPPLTPFDAQARVDYERLRRQVDYIIRGSKPAAVEAAAVEAQEYQYLTFEERQELIRRTVEFVDGRVPVVVGCSSPSVRHAATLANLAESLGAVAIQVLIPLRPSGGAATLKELITYYEAIARETSLPIVAYHNPGPGAEVTPATEIELAQLDAVQAFKESSRSMRHIGVVVDAVEKRGLAHYFTTMEVLLPSLLLGSSGGTMPPPGSTIGARIIASYREGRLADAAEAQRIFAAFPTKWMGTGGLTAAMKASLKIVGVDCGDPYPPFAALPPEQVEEMRAYLKGAGIDVPA